MGFIKIIVAETMTGLRKWLKTNFISRNELKKGYVDYETLLTSDDEILLDSNDEKIMTDVTVFAVAKDNFLRYLKTLRLV